MPSDDLILNVRQIANYSDAGSAAPTDSFLLQRGGLGGPYLSIEAQELVSTALAASSLPLTVGMTFPTDAQGQQILCEWASIDGIGSNIYLDPSQVFRSLQGGYGSYFNLRTAIDNGQVEWGITAPASPGQPVVMTQTMILGPLGNLALPLGTLTVAHDPVSPLQVATAQFVASTTLASFNGRRGAVWLNADDIAGAGGALIVSPRFGGEPRALTPPLSDASSRLATTAFVQGAIVGFVNNLLDTMPIVSTFNGRSGAVVLTEADIVAAGGEAIFDSPTFTGVPVAPTAPAGTNTQQLATTAFVDEAIAGNQTFAPLASPQFSGYPAGPTAAPGTSDGQLATTAFVMNAVTESTTGVASFNTRTGAVTLTQADIVAAGGATLTSPVFTGSPTAPTPAPGTANSTLATTAFVMETVGVTSFNGRTGTVTLTSADVAGAGGAPIASPTFTGTPNAPTAAAGTSTTQLATCAFVVAAIGATVLSFNGRAGAVTLTANDVSAAGGAILASPAFTGTPSAPTAAPATSTTQLATTAFVMAALAAGGGVASFNGRAGAVTLTTADVSAAGGPYLALSGGTLTGALIGQGATFGPLTATSTSVTTLAASSTATFNGGYTWNLSSANTPIYPQLSGPTTIHRAIQGATAGVGRWNLILGNSGGEPGSNAGSDFFIQNLSDTGALIGNPFSITRSTSIAQFNINTTGNWPRIDGPITINRSLAGSMGGSMRWQLVLGNSAAETGSNNGSLFAIVPYTDAGVVQTLVMQASRATGVVTFTQAIVNGPSDRALKENVHPIEEALAKVLLLRGVTFNMIADPLKTRQIGLIAQDVKPVVPEVIQDFDHEGLGRSSPTKLAIDYPKLTALLIEAVKTLAVRVGELELRVDVRRAA